MKYAIEVPATLGRSVQVTWCCHAANLVRDEGVAGSNPATPTKKPLQNKDLSHPARTGATASGQESGQIEGAPPALLGQQGRALSRDRVDIFRRSASSYVDRILR